MRSPQRDLLDRRRATDRRPQARSVHGPVRSGRAVRRRRAALRQRRDAAAPPAREAVCRKVAWPTRGAWRRRRRRSRASARFASRNTCPASGSCSSGIRTTGRSNRAGTRLPYLDRLVFMLVPSDDAQAMRFQSGEADIASRLSAENFDVLARDRADRALRALRSRRRPRLQLPVLQPERPRPAKRCPRRRASRPGSARWRSGRRSRSRSIAKAIVRLVYRGRATPLWGHVPPGNKLWVNRSLPQPARSLDARAPAAARRRLHLEAGRDAGRRARRRRSSSRS